MHNALRDAKVMLPLARYIEHWYGRPKARSYATIAFGGAC
jgi:hypothetical protein